MHRPTVDVYERDAEEYDRRRTARDAARAETFAADLDDGDVRVDLGCGPGRYLPALGRPVVALDAAHAMVALARSHTPHALGVQADLAALPFRDRSIAGAWASRSYVHVPRVELPMALAHLHWALQPEARAHLVMFLGDHEGTGLPDDDFPGRFFSLWDRDHLVDVVVGAGFDVLATDIVGESIHLDLVRARTLPDTVGPAMRLLVCGLNPSLYAADAGVGFARPGNRYWPAMLAAGLVSTARDTRAALRDHGIGMTDIVKRATVRADELTTDEYVGGLRRVERLAAWLQPGAICFVGLAGWRAAVDRKATAGWQERRLGGVPVYLMPSTSGLNARTPVAVLADHLRTAATSPPSGSRNPRPTRKP